MSFGLWLFVSSFSHFLPYLTTSSTQILTHPENTQTINMENELRKTWKEEVLVICHQKGERETTIRKCSPKEVQMNETTKRQCTNNATPRRVRITNVVVEKNKYFILECVFLSHLSSKQIALFLPRLSGSTAFFHTISLTARFSGKSIYI